MTPPKKYEMNPSVSWEERYHELKKHHIEETEYLQDQIKALEARINAMDRAMEDLVSFF